MGFAALARQFVRSDTNRAADLQDVPAEIRDYVVYAHEVSVAGLGLGAECLVWAAHASQEIGHWGVFLPQRYTVYKAASDTTRNPFADLSVTARGREARYRHIS